MGPLSYRLAYLTAKNQHGGVMLIQAAATRWASNVDLLESVIKNRSTIEAAILLLRAQNFDWDGNELMYLWELDFFPLLEKLARLLCLWICFAHQDPGFRPLRRLACVAGLLPFERPSALFRGGHLFDG